MKDFDFDVLQKKKAAYGAKHNKGKLGRRGCHLPSDNLTQSQLKKLNGEVYTMNINKPITYKEYKTLPIDMEKTYYSSLIERFNVGLDKIAKMMGTKANTLSVWNRRNGVMCYVKKGGQTQAQRKAWAEFINAEGKTPAEEEKQPERALEAQNEAREKIVAVNTGDGEKTYYLKSMVDISDNGVEIKKQEHNQLGGFHFTFTAVTDWRDILKLVGNMPLPKNANVIVTVEAG